MHQRLCQFALLVAILLAGCSRDRPAPAPRAEPAEADTRDRARIVRTDLDVRGNTARPLDPTPPPAGSTGDEVLASLPEQTKQERYEAALLEAVDFLADRKYTEALASLEKAQKYQDTGAVQREIDKVRTVLSQEAAATRAVEDVKTVLEDGKPEEAARLATTALNQFGGGDRAEDLARLQQEAQAVVTASAPDDTATRFAALKADAEAAIENKNLRAAAVALDQAVSLREDPILAQQLAEVRSKLRIYDDNRARAIEMRKDPTHVEEAITRLRAAREAWPTLQVQQELDECTLILERRRDRLSVADFEVIGDLGMPGASRTLSAELLPHFRPRFDLVERSQIQRVLGELNLEASELGDSPQGRKELGRLSRLRYLVVGTLSPLGGVTLQARLVEVPTGLIVQTARVTAPTVEALLPKLRQAALILQMSDDQKLAFEEKLQNAVVAIKPIDPAPIVEVPPPPPPPAPTAPPPPPIVTFTPRPPPMGGLVIEDFRRLPAVVVAPSPPPPALGLVIAQDDPRRHRLFRLSLELGDNCYRRGLFRDAQRHFSLALSIGGPRREVSLRLDSCRSFVPPPPPQHLVVVPPPVVVPRPIFGPAPVIAPPAPVVVVRQPVALVRPRVAVFGFLINCRPGLVPPASSEVLADQFASYCGGSYQVIDRGEVCWYMGRLGLTMREVLNDPISRRCLAQSLNARYFVFGAVQETASFDVQTHLVDPETGAQTGTGKIHVKDQEEMRMRLGELARQIGASPAQQQAIAQKGAASEKALNEARGLLAKDPGRASEVARAALKSNPDSVALQRLASEADQKARLAKFEAERRAAALAQAQAQAEAKKRQEALAKQAAEVRARAEAGAASRGTEEKKQQQAQRDRAAASLRAQAKQAQTKGEWARSVQLLQSASALQPSEAVFRELGQARVEAEKAAHDRALADQKKREDAQKAQRESALKRVQAEQEARARTDAERKKVEDARTQALHDGFAKQAHDQLTKKNYQQALAAAESARRYRNTPESLKLLQDVQHAIALQEAAKKGAAEKARVEAEQKNRLLADQKLQRDRTAYLDAVKKGQDALVARRFDEAVTHYQEATKLFRDPAALNSLKTAEDLRNQDRARVAGEMKAKEEAATRSARMKALIDQGNRALASRQHGSAIESFREALKLSPGNVDAAAGLSRAERERNEESARQAREKTMRERQVAIASQLAAGKASLNRKQPDEAAKSFREVLRLDPQNAEAKSLLANLERPAQPPRMETAYTDWMQKARAAVAAKRFGEAEKAYDQALQAKPGDAAAIQGKRDALARARESMPDPAVEARKKAYATAITQGRAATKAGDHAGAVRSFDEALKVAPGDATATKERADALRMQTEAAYATWMQRGNAALTGKRFAEAEKAFDNALKVKPGDAAAIRAKREAVEAGKKPMPPAVDPKMKAQQEAYDKAMVNARAALGQKKYLEGIRSLDEALRAKPGDSTATRDRAEAVRQLTEAAYATWMQRGQASMKAKQFGEAVKAFDEALKSKPGDPAGTKARGEAQSALQASMKPAPVPTKPPVPTPTRPTPPAPTKTVPTKQQEADYQLALGAARAAMKNKNLAGAVNAYNEALRLMPGDKVATTERAEAVRLYNLAAYAAWMKKGEEASKAKKFADAVKAYDEALKLKPGDATAIKGKKEATAAGKKP